MASSKVTKVKAPKVAMKVVKAAKISVGKTVAAKMTESAIAKTPAPKLKSIGLIKSPTVKTTAPNNGTLVAPHFKVGQKGGKMIP